MRKKGRLIAGEVPGDKFRIEVTMEDYIRRMNKIDYQEVLDLKKSRIKSRFLRKPKKIPDPLRKGIGQILWVTKTRYDCLAACCISAQASCATDPKIIERTVAELNLIIDHLQKTAGWVCFRYQYLENPTLACFADASAAVPHRVGCLNILTEHKKDNKENGLYDFDVYHDPFFRTQQVLAVGQECGRKGPASTKIIRSSSKTRKRSRIASSATTSPGAR